MKTQEKRWPCVRCTAKQYEEIRERLMKWGFSDNNRFTTDYQWHVFPILQTGYSNTNARTIGNYNILTRGDQYLCYDIPTFMRDVQEIAIREGWFKEEKLIMKEIEKQNENRTIVPNYIDWEQRRYEIAKEIMTQDVIVVDAKEETEIAKETACKAVLFADALIKELKKEK